MRSARERTIEASDDIAPNRVRELSKGDWISLIQPRAISTRG
jgi:hypothetical protein